MILLWVGREGNPMVRDFVVGGKKGKSYLASVSITVYHFVSVGNLYL